MTALESLAITRLQQWSAERQALKNGRIAKFIARPGRPTITGQENRRDAALVRCIDFEREFSKLPTDTQTILLLAYRERQSRRVIAQITGWSTRAIDYKLPAAVLDLARLLDRADLL